MIKTLALNAALLASVALFGKFGEFGEFLVLMWACLASIGLIFFSMSTASLVRDFLLQCTLWDNKLTKCTKHNLEDTILILSTMFVFFIVSPAWCYIYLFSTMLFYYNRIQLMKQYPDKIVFLDTIPPDKLVEYRKLKTQMLSDYIMIRYFK